LALGAKGKQRSPPVTTINFRPQLTRLSGRHFDLHQELFTHTIFIQPIKHTNSTVNLGDDKKWKGVLIWLRSDDRHDRQAANKKKGALSAPPTPTERPWRAPHCVLQHNSLASIMVIMNRGALTCIKK
jgi:hypothetical protein